MLQPPLTDLEVRLLGSLIEKEATTPDAYPLSASALTAACNQLSNRDPVMHLDETAVTEATIAPRRRSFLRAIQPAGSRVTKYQQLLGEALALDARALAVLCVLMLRGPQTLGELHARTGRLASFADLADLEAVVDALVERSPESLVVRLPRRAGQKEARYAHLLAGEVTPADEHRGPATAAERSPGPPAGDDRRDSLEQSVAALRAELADLREQFEAFRSQFG